MPYNKMPRLKNPTERDFVHQVRDMFLECYKHDPDSFYEEDMRQVKDMQFLLQRCIISKGKDVKASFNMLVNMCKWRKEQRIRELEDHDFPSEFFACGTAFLYEPDKYGNRTLYVRTQLIKTIPELKSSFKEFFAYLIYKIDDSIQGQSWSIIFDLTNTGWSNYDMDLLMYFLTLLKDYFPVNVDYVLCVNFPWVLSTVWTLAKRLIPPERRDVVVFINSSDIFKFVDRENVPDFLGGSCQREHQFSPKTCQTLVDRLLDMRDPEITGKRIKEIIKALSDVLPKQTISQMNKRLESSGR